jgi:hypothetical protein
MVSGFTLKMATKSRSYTLISSRENLRTSICVLDKIGPNVSSFFIYIHTYTHTHTHTHKCMHFSLSNSWRRNDKFTPALFIITEEQYLKVFCIVREIDICRNLMAYTFKYFTDHKQIFLLSCSLLLKTKCGMCSEMSLLIVVKMLWFENPLDVQDYFYVISVKSALWRILLCLMLIHGKYL